MRTQNAAVNTLVRVLEEKGWSLERSTSSALLWQTVRGSGSHQLLVPLAMQPGSFEWQDVLRRIADADGVVLDSLSKAIESSSFDVARFRIANSSLQNGTIPLEAGVTVVSSAYSMLRAAATTARRPRQSIGGGYSKIGDDYAQRARLGHTEVGSFVFPILMHIDEPPVDTHVPFPGTEFVQPESEERRVFRTLAQSLATFESRLVTPALEPQAVDLVPLVAAGGSKELFTQVKRVLSEPGVASFDMAFSWASTETPPHGAPERVVIPAEAFDIVTRTVELLSRPTIQPTRIVTGPIIDIEHVPGDMFGEIAIQTASANGRVGRVKMRVRKEQLTHLHQWMDAAATVSVQGVIERIPGRTPRLKDIAEPIPLDETLLLN